MRLSSTFSKRIEQGGEFTIQESFEWAKLCSVALSDPEDASDGREVIVRALEAGRLLPEETEGVWASLVEAAGLFQYVDVQMVEGASALWKEFHRSFYLEDTYFHSEQNEISIRLNSGESVVLSAPTSFGKSLLIEEMVASRMYRNIVIIQPTLALLDETRKKLTKYKDSYKLIVSTAEQPAADGNIFLFTGERVVEYRFWDSIDFFVIDEFYKLSLDRDDERAVSLNQALNILLKFTRRFYLLGPSVDSVPDEFSNQIAFKWHLSKFAAVALDEIMLGDGSNMDAEQRKEILFSLLLDLQEPSLVYCSAPDRSMSLVSNLLASGFSAQSSNDPVHLAEIERIVAWMSKNIHPDWSLCEALRRGIGFHHGGLPRHIGSSIVDLYNMGAITLLFCTSTLIEGVNTTAKNVVLFDRFKGRKPIDFFDFRNIAGRSGRMFKYFTGRLFRFDEPPNQYELNVDIPLFTQVSAPIELLMHLDPSAIKPEVVHKLLPLADIDPALLLIIKDNGISVEGQLAIVEEIEKNLEYYRDLLNWRNYPKYPQLVAVIKLGWDNLVGPKESKGGVRSPEQLAVITMGYMYNESLGALIRRDVDSEFWKGREPDPVVRANKVVAVILNAARHWLDYKLPKWLATLSGLQRYVMEKHGLSSGDYSHLANQLESGFLPSNLAILLEYDVPISALQKLRFRIDRSWAPEDVFAFLKTTDLAAEGLDDYERFKVHQALM